MIRGADGALCYLSGCNHEVFNTNRKRPGAAAWGGCAMPRDASGLLKRPCELKGYTGSRIMHGRGPDSPDGRCICYGRTPVSPNQHRLPDRHIHQSGVVVVISGPRSLWPQIRPDQRSTSCRFCRFAALIIPNKPTGPPLSDQLLKEPF